MTGVTGRRYDEKTGVTGRLDDGETVWLGRRYDWGDVMTGWLEDDMTIWEGGLSTEWRFFHCSNSYLMLFAIEGNSLLGNSRIAPTRRFLMNWLMICDYLYFRAKAHSSSWFSHYLKVVVNKLRFLVNHLMIFCPYYISGLKPIPLLYRTST